MFSLCSIPGIENEGLELDEPPKYNVDSDEIDIVVKIPEKTDGDKDVQQNGDVRQDDLNTMYVDIFYFTSSNMISKAITLSRTLSKQKAQKKNIKGSGFQN